MLSEVKEATKILAFGAATSIALCQLINRGLLRNEHISLNQKADIAKVLKNYKHYFWDHIVRQSLFSLPLVLAARYGNLEKLNYRGFIVPAMIGIGCRTLFTLKREDTLFKLLNEDKISRQEQKEKMGRVYIFSNGLFLLGLCGWALYKRGIFKNLL